MNKVKRKWKKVPSTVRKPLVFLLGVTIGVVGIILLPLPGPGWVVIFFGLAILATEFAFAERIQSWIINELKEFFAKVKKYFKRSS